VFLGREVTHVLRDLFKKHPGDTKSYHVPRILSLVAVVIFSLYVSLPPQIVRAEEESKESSSASKVLVKATYFVLQPFYLVGKTVTAITGTLISFVTLVGTVGDEEAADKILDDSLAGPWGIGEAVKKIESD
jgi:hypothetical protein